MGQQDVLDFLATRPDEQFDSAAIAKGTGISVGAVIITSLLKLRRTRFVCFCDVFRTERTKRMKYEYWHKDRNDEGELK